MPRFLENQKDGNKEKLSGGEWLMKTFGVGGCVFLLVMAAIGVFLCFTAGSNPIPGYEPAEGTEYYALHPEALQAELEAEVFPHIEGIVDCQVSGGTVRVTIEHEHFAVARSTLLHYFDESLLELLDAGKEE